MYQGWQPWLIFNFTVAHCHCIIPFNFLFLLIKLFFIVILPFFLIKSFLWIRVPQQQVLHLLWTFSYIVTYQDFSGNNSVFDKWYFRTINTTFVIERNPAVGLKKEDSLRGHMISPFRISCSVYATYYYLIAAVRHFPHGKELKLEEVSGAWHDAQHPK